MRYSRMLEESSFANRKADYFWLLFLSSLMLLVRLLISPDDPPHPNFYFHPRAYPHSSTSPFSPPRSPTCPSTFGPADIPRHPSRSLVCSPSQPLIFHLPLLRSPGCSLARGALRQAISLDVQLATWVGSFVTCGLARWLVVQQYLARRQSRCEFSVRKTVTQVSDCLPQQEAPIWRPLILHLSNAFTTRVTKWHNVCLRSFSIRSCNIRPSDVKIDGQP